jgi:hypothetical protein
VYFIPNARVYLIPDKVVLEARKRGITEARNLLHDWLVILYAKYNKCFSRSKSKATATLDFAFTKAQATRATSRQCAPTLPPPPPPLSIPQCLINLPTVIYAILRSPLLSPAPAHKGARLMMQHVLKSMPPQVRARAPREMRAFVGGWCLRRACAFCAVLLAAGVPAAVRMGIQLGRRARAPRVVAGFGL